MRIEINHNCADFNSYRAARVKSLFNAETGYNWQHVAELPIEDFEWKIGLIVGASGSGKSSIGAEIFGRDAVYDLYAGWANDRPVVDCIAPEGDFDAVTGSLSAVGLGDVPAWLRPFRVLSNGEKFRAGFARLICERPDRVVVDEFTSVVDRQIAKIGAAAFAKSWKRGSGQIVLLSCHYDIIEWLQPDWVYDTVEARFSRDCLRRPEIKLDIYKANGTLWKYYKKHYYLDLPYPPAAEYFIGMVGDTPVSHLAVCPFFTAKQATNKGNFFMVNRSPAPVPSGLKAKDLIGIPWMLAFALRADGWYLRQDIIWHKPNPMPESVKDRCTKAHEYVFLFTKSAKYYFDNRAIMQLAAYDGRASNIRKGSPKYAHESATGLGVQTFAIRERERWKCDENGNFMRNKRSVWTVTTQPEKEAHYACFPQNLIIDCIKAGCPEGGIVLDPFMGSGTTAVVARKLNRNYVGFELNPDYIEIAEKKLKRELGVFA